MLGATAVSNRRAKPVLWNHLLAAGESLGERHCLASQVLSTDPQEARPWEWKYLAVSQLMAPSHNRLSYHGLALDQKRSSNLRLRAKKQKPAVFRRRE